MRPCTLWYLLGASLISPRLGAQATSEHPPIQEFFQGEAVYPQDRGETQFTLTPRWTREDQAQTTTFEVGTEYGLTNAWQVQIGGDGFVRRAVDGGSVSQGIGDLALGTKYSWMRFPDGLTHAAIGVDVGLPTRNSVKQLGDGVVSATPYVVLAHDVPPLLHGQLFTELALSLKARHSTATPDTMSASAADSVNELRNHLQWNTGMYVQFGPFILTNEVTVERQIGRDVTHASQPVLVTPGLVWHSGALEVGAGVPIIFRNSVDGTALLLRLTYEFGGDKDHPNTP